MTVILDLMLVMVGVYYMSTPISLDNEILTYTDSYQDFHRNYSTNYGTTTTETQTTVLDQTFGDQKYGGQMWWTLFKAGITVPEACQGVNEAQCPAIERYLMRGYSFAFILINILLVLELFFIFYTKKNS